MIRRIVAWVIFLSLFFWQGENLYSAAIPPNCDCTITKIRAGVDRLCGGTGGCSQIWGSLPVNPDGSKHWGGGPYTGPGDYSNYTNFANQVCKQEGYQVEEGGCEIEGLWCDCSCTPACGDICTCTCTTTDSCRWEKGESCVVSGNCLPTASSKTCLSFVDSCDVCCAGVSVSCLPYNETCNFTVNYSDVWEARCTCTYTGEPCPAP